MGNLSVRSTESVWQQSAPTRAAFAMFMLAMIVATTGCGKAPYDLAPVRGKVTLDGKPLTQAKVMFAPRAQGQSHKAGKPAFGVLQPDGTFVLGTYEPEDGAVVGDHWVTVIRMSDSPGKHSAPGQAKPTKPAPTWERVIFPKTQTVVASEDNEISIELTSEIIARHGEVED